ncbi:MAG: nitric oxide reductase activation-like protein [Eubacteriaceae bacterium]
MDWIYSDYDNKNRLNNLMWTISEDYNEELENYERFSNISKDLAIYYAAKAGARRKYMDWKLIKKYVHYKISKGVDKDIFIPLVDICADLMIEEKLLKERPGMVDVRKKGYDELLEIFLKFNSKDIMDKIKYSLVFEQMGKSVLFDKKVKDILNDVKECMYAEDTYKLINNIEYIYSKHFNGDITNVEEYDKEYYEQFEEMEDGEYDLENKDDFSRFIYEELYNEGEINQEISEDIDKISSSLLVESMGEFQNRSNDSHNRNIYVDDETAKKIYDKIEYYYGKAFLNKDEIKKIERKICRNIHEGCRVHFTDGVLRTPCENLFQKKYVTRQKENNLSYYAEHPRVNKRNIAKLKQTIIKTMIAESEITKISADNGIIMPNKLWKIGRSKDLKVFSKIVNNEKGGYVVDILLDASGSQRINQGKVATQAYIISEALVLAGIPNRVMGFSSFLDYTILRRFRDYSSPRNDNKNIFEYYSAGNNRDGLAIRAVCEGLMNRKEDNKILIILSDGKPNDIKISKNKQKKLVGEVPYRGIAAIKDTALEVRKARRNDILVLGVFTGKEEELYAEKFIYGKDFIYTKSIERFSDIVGTFLKRVIENM